jgi:hypothetical protein
MRKKHKSKGNHTVAAMLGRFSGKRGEKMGHELQSAGIIVVAVVVAMMLIMISLPVSNYGIAQSQPASLIPEPQPEQTPEQQQQAPAKTTVTIIYTSNP